MKKSVVVVTLVFLSLLLLLAACISTESNRASISVSGQAKKDVMPDKADVSVKIQTDGRTALEAQQHNAQRSAQVRQALADLGFKPDEIETTSFYLDVKRVWENNQYKDVGYQQIHVLKVTVYELDKVGSVIDVVVKAGANGIDGVAFGLKDETKDNVLSGLLKEAVTEAQNKADTMAQVAHVRIKGVRAMSESGEYVPFYYARESLKAMSAEAPPTELNPQKIDVTKSVSMVFDIG